jgi:hypothetical protein
MIKKTFNARIRNRKRRKTCFMKFGGREVISNVCAKIAHTRIQAKKLASNIGKRHYKCNICRHYHLTSQKDFKSK